MRSKKNIKKFGHTSKNKSERINYANQINGTAETLSEELEPLNETFPKEQISGNPEEIINTKKPYESWRVWWDKNKKNFIVNFLGIAIILPLLTWLIVSFVNYGTEIKILKINSGDTKEDIVNLQNKYDKINDKTIRSETLLGQIREDIKNLMGYIINP